ncbi:hypothetical protein [Paraburkholderia sp.]|uniref:hypothetical protein n=1 Tax=Paraburkholderia sp. TaxID=1926495 RepID=UPI003C7DD54B
MKRLYMMSPAEYELFTAQCNPPALLVVTNGNTPSWNKFQAAEDFWTALGAVHGFDWTTAEPCEGKHVAYYRAVPLETP